MFLSSNQAMFALNEGMVYLAFPAAVYEHFKDKEYPEIVFLGTGSAKPTPSRNVSAILVHTG